MFSHEHGRIWNDVAAGKQLSSMAAMQLLTRAQALDDSFADLFFATDLGTGGKLDEEILKLPET